jgi:hypothetical protein
MRPERVYELVAATGHNEEEAVLGWQLKRDGARRGIVEVTEA